MDDLYIAYQHLTPRVLTRTFHLHHEYSPCPPRHRPPIRYPGTFLQLQRLPLKFICCNLSPNHRSPQLQGAHPSVFVYASTSFLLCLTQGYCQINIFWIFPNNRDQMTLQSSNHCTWLLESLCSNSSIFYLRVLWLIYRNRNLGVGSLLLAFYIRCLLCRS